MHRIPDAERTKHLTTDELREGFLVSGLFQPDTINLRHIDLDRVVLGGAVPCCDTLALAAPESFKSEYFTERRELGVLNIGALGTVTVDGTAYTMAKRDVLYVGRGHRDISFESASTTEPARFYLVSYPAHSSHPTTLIAGGSVEGSELGTAESANRRNLARYIHLAGAASGQLVMGVTSLVTGNVWNTMPAHTHARRTEVYLYFDLPDDAIVVHLMGEPHETRHLIVRNEEVILSPHWSVHSGCGTSNYTFCWAMGGENQDFTDMQAVDMRELK